MTDSTTPNEEDVEPSRIAEKSSTMDELMQIFSIVAEAPSGQQEALLADLCSEPALREHVRQLLSADSDDDPLLDHALVPSSLLPNSSVGSSSASSQVNMRVGERIDGYTLLQELAQGGMGVVFLAEQTVPVRRTVALKVIKPGVDTREVIARFNAERQALSLMDHPNIAKVLDAGSTEAGRPYFVMELVNGQPITTYCDQNQLTAKQRLELFLPVCHAIQHAHQKGIIHRDIKPSNVLVAEYDGRPVAKVIDFGVAKAINQSLTEMTVATGLGQIIGTFEYMSPEQSRVNQLDVDTRTDIYSLGVLLYELLTGWPPFDKDRLRSVAWDEMLRIIREEDPPKPSARLSANSGWRVNRKQADDAGNLPREPARYIRMVKGELDWIVMKAMEKDRTRRYGTPNGLANDIGRFLRGEAVSACPPSAMYLFSKFARRNKAVIATTALVAAAMIIGLIGTSVLTFRALRAEASALEAKSEAIQAGNAAKKNAAESKAVIAFIKDDLLGLAGAESQLSAGLRPDPNLKLTTLLDRAQAKMNGSFAEELEVRATLQDTLASSFTSIGSYGKAASLRRELFEYLRSTQGPNHPDTLYAMRNLARAYFDESNFDEAEATYKSALEIVGKNKSLDNRLKALLLNDRAMLYQTQKQYPNSEAAYQSCLEIRNSLLGENHPDTLGTTSNLATLYESLGRFDEAEKLHQRVLQLRRSELPQQYTSIADALHNLGRCYLKRGRYDDDETQYDKALPLLNESLEINRSRELERGNDHPATIWIRCDRVQVYLEQGKLETALPLLEVLVNHLRDAWSDTHATTLEVRSILCWTYMQLGRLEEAENKLAEILSSHAFADPSDPRALRIRGNLAIAQYRLGKLQDSIETDEGTLAMAQQTLEPYSEETLACRARLGLSYLETGRASEGRAQLVEVFGTQGNHRRAFSIAGKLADSFAEEGDAAGTLLWSEQQVLRAQNTLPANSLQLADVMAACGIRLMQVRAWSEAEDVLRSCLAIHEIQSPNTPGANVARALLNQAMNQQSD